VTRENFVVEDDVVRRDSPIWHGRRPRPAKPQKHKSDRVHLVRIHIHHLDNNMAATHHHHHTAAEGGRSTDPCSTCRKRHVREESPADATAVRLRSESALPASSNTRRSDKKGLLSKTSTSLAALLLSALALASSSSGGAFADNFNGVAGQHLQQQRGDGKGGPFGNPFDGGIIGVDAASASEAHLATSTSGRFHHKWSNTGNTDSEEKKGGTATFTILRRLQSVFDDHSDHDDHADHDDGLDPVVVGVEETALSLVDEDHEGHDHDEEDAGADVR
jgi:hypothetical protein